MADPGFVRLRRRVGAFAIDNFFLLASKAGKLHPLARPDRHGVEVQHDVAYTSSGRHEHRLDIYAPRDRSGPLPTVLYVHGGGFRILSKDTHWMMGLAFAKFGYLVFNISYRLAPRHPFPAAVEDCAAAFEWVAREGHKYGADLDRLVIAGESAGANLTTSLALMSCYERPEPYARRVHATGIVPRAALPFCGVLQVSDAERFRRRKPQKISAFLNDRLLEVSRSYLGDDPAALGGALDLADPLVVLERAHQPARPLPPFFAAVGTADPLLDDTRRLKVALDRLGVPCEAQYYPGGVHAFHAMMWRKDARRCWGDALAFLERHVPRNGAGAGGRPEATVHPGA
jgi:acetyl esterase/lipase